MRNMPLTSVFKKFDMRIFGQKAIYVLPDKKVLEITLVTELVAKKYKGLKAKIVHPESGIISENYFKFDEYLFKRMDERSDYTQGFHIWDNDDNMDWYIARPDKKEVEDMVRSILTWADAYRA